MNKLLSIVIFVVSFAVQVCAGELTGPLGSSAHGGGVTPSGTFTVGDLIVGAGSTSIQDSANVSGGVSNMPGAYLGQTTVSSAPSSICSTNSYAVAFTCDLSKMKLALGMSITGATTLGNPTSTYQSNPNLSLLYGYYSNASGVNSGTSGTGPGRTLGSAIYIKADALGQGDTSIIFGSVFVNSTCPVGATSFLACAAGSLLAGGVSANTAGAYLQPIGDINCSDNGFDVACINAFNMNRTVNTGALGVAWDTIRVQSTGTAAIDVAFSATGLINVGYDISNATLGTNAAAMTMKAGQRIYTAATGGNFFPSAVGTDYHFSPAAGQFEFVAGGSNVLDYGVTAASTWNTNSGLRVASLTLVGSGGSTLTSPTAQSFQLGSADAAAPSAKTLRVQSVVAGTSNIGGVNWSIVGSLSTGSGVSGDIIFQTGGTGAGAAVQNSAVNALVIKGATQSVQLPVAVTGTPTASLCLDASNNIIKKTTTGSCV